MTPQVAGASPIVSFVPMIVVIGILYLLIIRPQQQQAKEHKRMVDNLKTGDRVITQGGIHGTVTSLKGNIVQVKIAAHVSDGTPIKVDVSRSAISQVLTDPVSQPAVPVAS